MFRQDTIRMQAYVLEKDGSKGIHLQSRKPCALSDGDSRRIARDEKAGHSPTLILLNHKDAKDLCQEGIAHQAAFPRKEPFPLFFFYL